MKKCGHCKTLKHIEHFGKRKTSLDGLDYVCFDCKRIESKKAHQRNKDEINKRKRLYRESPKVKKQRAEYAKMHPANSKIHKQWQQLNRLKVRSYCRRRREAKRQLDFMYTPAHEKITRQLFAHLCFKCKKSNNLEIDHHYPLSLGHGLELSNAVLLCKSCNSSKCNKLPQDFYSAQELYTIDIMLSLVAEGPM